MKGQARRKKKEFVPPVRTGVDILNSVINHLDIRAKLGTISAKELFFSIKFVEAARSRVEIKTSTASVLSSKERASMERVESLLKEGKNPFSADELKKQGKNLGGAHESEATNGNITRYEKTDTELQNYLEERSQFWKSGVRSNPRGKLKFRDDSQLLKELGLAPETPFERDKPGHLTCSYCGKQVLRSEATIGKVINPQTLSDKLKVKVACSEHSLYLVHERWS